MTDVIAEPNTNLAQPQNFRLTFATLPNMVYNCRRVGFPGVNGGQISVPTPFQSLELSGTSFEHDPLTVDILLNEDYSSWYSIVNWIKQRTISESFTQYAAQAASDQKIYSDCSIQLYNSANRLQAQFDFEDAFPISVGGFELDSSIDPSEPISFQAVFQYQKFSKSS